MQHWLRLIILSVLFLFVSCSQKSLSLFFDIPASSPEEVQLTVANDKRSVVERVKKTHQTDVVPLSVIKIENAKTWQEAEALLPKNKLGERDWVLALKESAIQPRTAIGGDRTLEPFFKFDFYLKSEIPMFDAYFPHSTHTEHLDCASCHPKVFRYRGTKITMEKIFAGEYCGTCHGSVAFAPSAENCARCHTSLLGE